MKINFSERLSYRLTRNTVVVALLLGTLLSLAQVVFDYFSENSSLDKEIKAIITISHAPASQIAYNIDARLAEELLEGLLEHPAIIQASIIDTDGRVLANRVQAPASSRYRWVSDLLFGKTRTYQETLAVPQLSDVVLGDIRVVADTHPTGTAFLERSGITVATGFVRSLILSAILLFLYYTMLTKPLIKVANALSQVDPQTPEKIRLPTPKGHENDEIGLLVTSTNRQLKAIEQSLTKLRQAEASLKGYSGELEKLVESRTREISEKNRQLVASNQDLHVAKEDAVRRAKARADFLASMSHEIRTPFNGVLGMISLTLEEPLSDKQKEQLNVAYGSGIALLELLNDILDISKVEAGKLTLENISFSLRKTVEDVATLLAQNAHAKHVALYTDIKPDFPERVWGDPTRVRQIISNLTGNAIKFTEEGSVTVRLFVDAEERVVIEVEDTGIGIPEDRLEQIFSPFAQGFTDTTRKYGGTGLGLTLCKQLVTHMNGELEVESQLQVGSTFRVLLPLAFDRNVKAPGIDPHLRDFGYLLIHRRSNQTFSSIAEQLTYWGLQYRQIPYDSVGELDISSLQISVHTILFVDSRSIPPLFLEHAERERLALVLVARQHIPTDIAYLNALRIRHMVSAPVSRESLYGTLCKVSGVDEHPAYAEITETASQDSNGQRILLVEDNQVNQMVAKTILKKLGYSVSIAQNGRDAVDMVAAEDFDLVLMDCHMPVMDGYEATQQIRSMPKYRYLPIVAVTANVMQGDKERCFNAGMNDYLTKPYEKRSLVKVLQKWLGPDRPYNRQALG